MISIVDLCKEFPVGPRVVRALQKVNLNIGQGEFFVLLGASGSGKTTLVRCVAGLEVATSGMISLGSRVVYSSATKILVRAEERNIGMVFQSYAVWPHLTVFDNIALPLRKGRRRLRSMEDVRARVARVLEAVDLRGMETRPVPTLSGGQQQRVSLARALAVEPDALLMDEPLSNLDARLRERVRDQIRQLAKKFGITVMYVTHDQTEAMALADRIAVMSLGEIKQVGTPRELYNRPGTSEVAEFFGDMNWLRGRWLGNGEVETAVGIVHTSAPPPANGSTVRLGIRPEHMTISADRPTGLNTFRAQLETTTFLGDRQSLVVDVAGSKLIAHINGAVELASRDIWVTMSPDFVLTFTD